MGLLDQVLAGDAAAFIDADGWGESITYINIRGVRRTIFAVVEREEAVPLPGPSQAHISKVTIVVANNSTTGIASAEISEGDMVALDLLKSGKIKTLRINAGTYGQKLKIIFAKVKRKSFRFIKPIPL